MANLYEPGTAPLVSSKTNFAHYPFNAKRALSADEYNIYRAALDDDKLPAERKAGVAIILLDDLKMVYGEYWEQYPDATINKFVNIYKTYQNGTHQKKAADGEIQAFNNFRNGKNPFIVDDEVYLHNFLRQKSERILYGKELARRASEAIKAKNIAVAKEEARMKKIADSAMAKTGDSEYEIVTKAMNDYMRKNIIKYLGDIFNAHGLSTNITEKQAEMEYEARTQIAKRVVNGELEPVPATASYKKMLSLIQKNPGWGSFKYELKQTFEPNYHPIWKHLNQTGANYASVTTRANPYAHPMAKKAGL